MSRTILTAALLLSPWACPALHAAEPPSWKFEPGLSNRYRLTQQTNIDRTGAGGDAKASTTLVIDSSWTVKEVQDDGSAVLDQRIDRMRVSMSTGEGQKAEIDSQSADSPQGPAAMLTPLLKAVTSHPFQVTMTPRGEITHVEVPEALTDALKNQPGAAQMGELATAEGFKKLISQAALVLPETLEPGAEFTRTTETAAPAVGKQIATTTYRYDGSRDVNGKTMEVFTPSITVSFEGGPASIEVAEQSSKGELLFNRTYGRLESSRLDQHLSLRISIASQQTQQKIEQTVETQWLPPGEP
jgi:hypothetical protein